MHHHHHQHHQHHQHQQQQQQHGQLAMSQGQGGGGGAAQLHSSLEPPPSRRRPKRKQVKRACSNCRKSHSGCDDKRPCTRCMDNGLEASCADIPRKKRATRRKPFPADPSFAGGQGSKTPARRAAGSAAHDDEDDESHAHAMGALLDDDADRERRRRKLANAPELLRLQMAPRRLHEGEEEGEAEDEADLVEDELQDNTQGSGIAPQPLASSSLVQGGQASGANKHNYRSLVTELSELRRYNTRLEQTLQNILLEVQHLRSRNDGRVKHEPQPLASNPPHLLSVKSEGAPFHPELATGAAGPDVMLPQPQGNVTGLPLQQQGPTQPSGQPPATGPQRSGPGAFFEKIPAASLLQASLKAPPAQPGGNQPTAPGPGPGAADSPPNNARGFQASAPQFSTGVHTQMQAQTAPVSPPRVHGSQPQTSNPIQTQGNFSPTAGGGALPQHLHSALPAQRLQT